MQTVDNAIIRAVAVYAVVLGLVSSHRRGVDFRPPSPDKTFNENLLTMTAVLSHPGGCSDAVKVACFRQASVYSADHGLALSVFSALVTASSLTDPISSLIASLAASYGPLHMGASQMVHRMLEEIGSVDNVPAFIAQVKSGRRKLLGYGHRLYKGIDPRMRLISPLLKQLDVASDPLFKIAERLEQVASSDDYFIQRKLYPNPDLYGHFILSALYASPLRGTTGMLMG